MVPYGLSGMGVNINNFDSKLIVISDWPSRCVLIARTELILVRAANMEQLRKSVKLNMGCGNKQKTGFFGVDAYWCGAVDVMADLTKQLPFKTSSIDEIYLDNVIEHVFDISALMREIHRICIDKSKVVIVTPHFASADSWRDPTHVHHLSYFSMDHFQRQSVAHYTGGGFEVARRNLSFGGILGNIGRLIFSISPRLYENTWCFIFRPGTLRFELTVVKSVMGKQAHP